MQLSGWVHRVRNHGGVMFLDLRDGYGMTQCVVEETCKDLYTSLQGVTLESVISVTGQVALRAPEAMNTALTTGEIEVRMTAMQVLSLADEALPLPVNSDQPYPEDVRLSHRFLDLRRSRPRALLNLRSDLMHYIRTLMKREGFQEIHTPVLTGATQEGARDFVVPSRWHEGKFYALPQAPQQFKQILMASGVDRYFQIAPCFRDEDLRANRALEFYQWDFEMAFVNQKDVLGFLAPLMGEIFSHFSSHTVNSAPFPCIPYHEALEKYGSDKPDLRNPLVLEDYTAPFQEGEFPLFREAIGQNGAVVKALRATLGEKSRKFFDTLTQWICDAGAKGLAYVYRAPSGEMKGPLAKYITLDLAPGDVCFFVCDQPGKAQTLGGLLRDKVAQDLGLIDENTFMFCWVTDFPMFEQNETGQVTFCHNPFSMPQGEYDVLTQDPMTWRAWQYDLVVNGVELSSGAIRNHKPDLFHKICEKAGYSTDQIFASFGPLLRAFRYGVPPHGGAAPGLDRMIMLLAQEPNIREVIPFPMNQQGIDSLMGAPTALSPQHLKEIHWS